MANQLNQVINSANRISQWMTYGRTVLCQEDPSKGRAVNNYRLISYLSLMWRLLPGMIDVLRDL